MTRTASAVDPYTGEPADHLFTAKDNRGLPGAFDYFRGPTGLVFLDPIPDNLGDHYAGGYQQIPQSVSELAEVAKGDAYRLEIVKKHVASGDFLEIGPWIGLVSYSARQAGYRVHALERSEECVALMQSAGIDAVQTNDPAKALAASGETYDVIGLWHSIEHLPRPWEVIDAAAKALRPGGLLVIAAPNPESAQFRVAGRHWLHLDAPRHINLIPASIIEEIGRRNGLETMEKTTDDHLGELIDDSGWTWEMHRRVGRIPLVRAIYNRLFRGLVRARHRTPGAFDGAGYTLAMRRPA